MDPSTKHTSIALAYSQDCPIGCLKVDRYNPEGKKKPTDDEQLCLMDTKE
jgi:hypothetical protein